MRIYEAHFAGAREGHLHDAAHDKSINFPRCCWSALKSLRAGSGGGQRLSAETASSALAFLLDLRSARP